MSLPRIIAMLVVIAGWVVPVLRWGLDIAGRIFDAMQLWDVGNRARELADKMPAPLPHEWFLMLLGSGGLLYLVGDFFWAPTTANARWP